MNRLWPAALILCVWCFASVSTLRGQQALPEVRLEMHDDNSQLLMGDRIVLDLVFRSATPGAYVVDVTEKLDDKIEITPATGWLEWRGRRGMKDFFDNQPLTAGEIRVPLTLNQGYVFRQPGHYEVRVTTKRLVKIHEKKAKNDTDDAGPPPAVTTNSIGFDLSPMPQAEEAQRVRALLAEIAGTGNETRDDSLKRDDLFEQLAALQGEDAMRAKVDLIRMQDSHAQDEDIGLVVHEAMASTLNLPLQLAQLQAVWNDPGRAPLGNVAGAMSITHHMMRDEGMDHWYDVLQPGKRTPSQELAYAEHMADLDALLRSLPLRSGASLTGAAYYLQSDSTLPPEKLAAVKQQLVAEFAHMDKDQQSLLLSGSWKTMRDPALIGPLRAVLDAQPNADYPLRRLIELDASVARPYVIRAICHGMPLHTVQDLPDATLPEVDGCLGEQLSVPILKIQDVYTWHARALLAARFATAAALPAIRRGWTDDYEDGPVFALLLRYEPAEAMARIETVRTPKYAEQNLVMRFRDIATAFESRRAALPAEFQAWLQQAVATGPRPRAERAAELLAAEKRWMPAAASATSDQHGTPAPAGP